MGKINWGRVVLGGLLAGVVLNVVDWLTYGVWLKADMAAAMQALGKQPGAMDSAIPLWVYAAIRPRFGAGAKTAVIAGLAVWFFVGLLHAIGESPMGFMPQRLMMIGTCVALVSIPVATVVGAYVYKEM